jgi:hypothetical protein
VEYKCQLKQHYVQEDRNLHFQYYVDFFWCFYISLKVNCNCFYTLMCFLLCLLSFSYFKLAGQTQSYDKQSKCTPLPAGCVIQSISQSINQSINPVSILVSHLKNSDVSVNTMRYALHMIYVNVTFVMLMLVPNITLILIHKFLIKF